MFTGLIEDTGEIKKLVSRGNGLQMALESHLAHNELQLGESIAVDGACLTVTSLTNKGFTVDVSPETLQRTTLGTKKAGHKVNLERALRLSDRLGGHLVTGHIDGIAVITARQRTGESRRHAADK